jgi:hypothetical protein
MFVYLSHKTDLPLSHTFWWVEQELRTAVQEIIGYIEHLLNVASSKSVSLVKMQDMFRTLGVHELVIESITSLMTSDLPRMPNDESLTSLLYNSFCFLALFARYIHVCMYICIYVYVYVYVSVIYVMHEIC